MELGSEILSYRSLCFPSLFQVWSSSPEVSIFTLGMKFSSRNWKYFATFFFFFNLSIKQFYLFSLESYATVGLIFIYLAYFFPTDCIISTFYIKKERSEPWSEPQAWELTLRRKYIAQGIRLKGESSTPQRVNKMSTKRREFHWSWFFK